MGAVYQITWSPDSRFIASASKDSTVKYIPATKLSEGETNVIAFLYFYFMAVNTDESGSDKNSIVVIDDPVS